MIEKIDLMNGEYDTKNESGFTADSTVTQKDMSVMLSLDSADYIEEQSGTLDACRAWLEKNPDIYTVLRDKEKSCIGYINFTPLTPDAYKKFRSGELSDMQMSPEHIASYEKSPLRMFAKKVLPEFIAKYIKGNTYDALFMSIVIDENHRHNKEAVRVLTNAFGNKMRALEQQGISIERVLSECVSQDGRNFCERLGAKTIRDETKGSEIKDVKEGQMQSIFNFLNKMKSKAAKKENGELAI